MSTNVGNLSMGQVPISKLNDLQKQVDDYKIILDQYLDLINEYTELIDSGLDAAEIGNNEVLDKYHNIMIQKDNFVKDVFENIGHPPKLHEMKEEYINLDNRFSIDLNRLINSNMHPSYYTSKLGKLNSESLDHPTVHKTLSFKLMNDIGLSKDTYLTSILDYDSKDMTNLEKDLHDVIKIGRKESNTRLIEFTLSYNQYNLNHFSNDQFDYIGRTYTGDIDDINILSRQYRGILVLTNLKEENEDLSVSAHIMCPDNDLKLSNSLSIGPEITLNFMYDREHVYVLFENFLPFRFNWDYDSSGNVKYFDMTNPDFVMKSRIQYEWFGYITDLSYKQNTFDLIKYKDINFEDVSKFDSLVIRPLKEGFIRYKNIGFKSTGLTITPQTDNNFRWTNRHIVSNKTNGTSRDLKPLLLEMEKTNFNKINPKIFYLYELPDSVYYCTNLGLYEYNWSNNKYVRIFEYPTIYMGFVNNTLAIVFYNNTIEKFGIKYSSLKYVFNPVEDEVYEDNSLELIWYSNGNIHNILVEYYEDISSFIFKLNNSIILVDYTFTNKEEVIAINNIEENYYKTMLINNNLIIKYKHGIYQYNVNSLELSTINIDNEFDESEDIVVDIVRYTSDINELGAIVRKSSGDYILYYINLYYNYSLSSKDFDIYETILPGSLIQYDKDLYSVVRNVNNEHKFSIIETNIFDSKYTDNYEFVDVDTIDVSEDTLDCQEVYNPYENINISVNRDSYQTLTVFNYTQYNINFYDLYNTRSLLSVKRDIQKILNKTYNERQSPVNYKIEVFFRKDDGLKVEDKFLFDTHITELGRYVEAGEKEDDWKFRGNYNLRQILINKNGDMYFSGFHAKSLPLFKTDGSVKYTNEFFSKITTPFGKKVKDVLMQMSQTSQEIPSRFNYLFMDGYYGYSGSRLMYKSPYKGNSQFQETLLTQENLYNNSSNGKIIIPEKLPDGETLNNGQVDNVFSMEGSNGVLGYQLKDGRVFIPTKYQGFIKKMTVSAPGSQSDESTIDYGYTLILSNDGQLFVTGKIKGTEEDIENWIHSSGKFVRLLPPNGNFILDYWTGNYGEIIVEDEFNDYYCLGYNANGRLGLQHTNTVTKWEKFVMPEGYIYQDIKQFAFTPAGTIILMNDGSMWAAGDSTNKESAALLNLSVSETGHLGFRKCILENIDRIILPNSSSYYYHYTIMCVDKKGNPITFGQYTIDENETYEESCSWRFTKLPENYTANRIQYFHNSDYYNSISHLVINNKLYVIGGLIEDTNVFGLGYITSNISQWAKVLHNFNIKEVFRTLGTLIILDDKNNLWYIGYTGFYRTPFHSSDLNQNIPTPLSDQIPLLKDNIKRFYGYPGHQIVELIDGRYVYWGQPTSIQILGNNDSVASGDVKLHTELNTLSSDFYTYHEEPLLRNKRIVSWSTDSEGSRNHIIVCSDGDVFVQDETGHLSLGNTSIFLQKHPVLIGVKKIIVSELLTPGSGNGSQIVYCVLYQNGQLKFIRFHPLTRFELSYSFIDFTLYEVEDIYAQALMGGLLIKYKDRNQIDSILFNNNPLYPQEEPLVKNVITTLVTPSTDPDLVPIKIYDNGLSYTKSFIVKHSDGSFSQNMAQLSSIKNNLINNSPLSKTLILEKIKAGALSEDIFITQDSPTSLVRFTNPALPQSRPSRLEIYEKDSYIWFDNKLYYSGLNKDGLGLLGSSHITSSEVDHMPIMIPNPGFDPTIAVDPSTNPELIADVYSGVVYGFDKQFLFKEIDLSSLNILPSTIKKFIKTSKNLYFIVGNTLYGGGDNLYGQLAQGHTDNIDLDDNPLGLVIMGDDIEELMCVTDYSVFVRKTDGFIYAVGRNDYRQLGITSQDNIITEFEQLVILNHNEIDEIYSSGRSTFAVYNSDIIMAVGKNNTGQLGIGNVLPTLEWQTCLGVTKIREMHISDEFGYTLILTDNETVLHTGEFYRYTTGGLGDSTTKSNRFQNIGLTNIEKIHIYKDSMYAINKEGELFVKGCVYGYLDEGSIRHKFNRVGYSPEISDTVRHVDGIYYMLIDDENPTSKVVIIEWTRVPVRINNNIESIDVSDKKILAVTKDGSILYSGYVPFDKNLDRTYINRTTIENGHVEEFEFLKGIQNAKRVINSNYTSFMYIDTDNNLWGGFSSPYTNDDDLWFIPIGALFNISYEAENIFNYIPSEGFTERDLVVSMYRGFESYKRIQESVGYQLYQVLDESQAVDPKVDIDEVFQNITDSNYPNQKFDITLTLNSSKVENINYNVVVKTGKSEPILIKGTID